MIKISLDKEKKLSIKLKKERSQEQNSKIQNLTEENEIIFAILQQQIGEINKKIFELQQKLQVITKTEILKEIETISSKIKDIDLNIEKYRFDEFEKKQELKEQIQKTFGVFEQIKELLKIDYDNLVIQRDQLKKYLVQQETEYNNIVEKYSIEIKNLKELITDLKHNYPEELSGRLQIEISKKTQILENLKKEYNDLKQNSQQKLSFLDEVLNKKSEEIKILLFSLKQQNEQELLDLKTKIQQLEEQKRSLDLEVKSIVKSIYEEQRQKSDIVQKLNNELKELKLRQNEINFLRLKESSLKIEIENLKKEYDEIKKEFKELSYKKAEGIKKIQLYTKQEIDEIIKRWQQQEEFYQKEIAKLKNRIQTLKNRREKLLNIQKEIKEKFSQQQKDLQQKIYKDKTEFEKKKTEFENIIKKNISRMEIVYDEIKQKIQSLKTALQQKLQNYNDKILELKKRGNIREERIKRNIEKSQLEYERILFELNSEVDSIQNKVVEEIAVLNGEKRRKSLKILAQKERLSVFQTQIREIVKNISEVKKDINSYEEEVTYIEKQIYSQFDDLYNKITNKKEALVEKLRQMLTEQEVSIIKIYEKSKEIKKYEKL
ncbi:MAG: hypothetical protein NC816_01455 [Candidatus Omnitrophica bacterium]|nr:hypothetical protein [Candidatus Omnitrophota bacterium]